MKIKCQNCNSIYNIEKDKIPISGRKVKCTSCGHIWVQMPEFDESEVKNKSFNKSYNKQEKHSIQNNTDEILYNKGRLDRNDTEYANQQNGKEIPFIVENNTQQNYQQLSVENKDDVETDIEKNIQGNESTESSINNEVNESQENSKDNNIIAKQNNSSDDNLNQNSKENIEKEQKNNRKELSQQSESNSAIKSQNNKKNKTSLLMKVLSSTMIGFLMFFFIGIFQNKMPYNIKKIYRIIKIYDTNGIQLTSPSFEIFQEHDITSLKIEGIIENNSQQERFVPDIHFVVYDKNKKELYSEKLNSKIAIIAPKNQYKFNNTLKFIPKDAETVQIKVGNIIERYFQ